MAAIVVKIFQREIVLTPWYQNINKEWLRASNTISVVKIIPYHVYISPYPPTTTGTLFYKVRFVDGEIGKLQDIHDRIYPYDITDLQQTKDRVDNFLLVDLKKINKLLAFL